MEKNKKPIELQKALNASLLELIELTEKNLHPELYAIDEICELLGTTQQELILNSLTPNTANCIFKLNFLLFNLIKLFFI